MPALSDDVGASDYTQDQDFMYLATLGSLMLMGSFVQAGIVGGYGIGGMLRPASQIATATAYTAPATGPVVVLGVTYGSKAEAIEALIELAATEAANGPRMYGQALMDTLGMTTAQQAAMKTSLAIQALDYGSAMTMDAALMAALLQYGGSGDSATPVAVGVNNAAFFVDMGRVIQNFNPPFYSDPVPAGQVILGKCFIEE